MVNINDENIESMSFEEINVQLVQLVNKLRKAKFSAALGSLENPNVLTSYKREIARIKTVLKSKNS